MATKATHAKPEKPAWGPARAISGTLLAMFISQTIGYLIVYSIPFANQLIIIDNNNWAIVGFEIGLALIIALVIISLIYDVGGKVKQLGFYLRDIKGTLAKTFLAFGVYMAGTIAMYHLLTQFVTDTALNQEQDLGFSQADGTFAALLPIFISLVIVAPIIEEILFRGFLFKGLRQKLSFWPAAILSAGIFASVHMQFNVIVDVFLMALAAAWVLEKTDSIYAAMLLHGLKNIIAFTLLYVVVLK